MFYDRKVIYLDYCEDGERLKGCGVAKFQAREKTLNVEIMVSGLPAEVFLPKPILVKTENAAFELGTIHIENGRGNFRYRCGNWEDMAGVAPYMDWTGLQIVLDEGREISCSWKAGQQKTMAREQWETPDRQELMEQVPERQEWMRQAPERQEPRVQASEGQEWMRQAPERQEPKVQAPERQEPKVQVPERQEPRVQASEGQEPRVQVPERQSLKEGEETRGAREADANRDAGRRGRRRSGETAAEGLEPYRNGREETRQERETRNSEGGMQAVRPVTLAEDKWSQLWRIYPHVNPFGDEREYLSIRPSDFVLFSSDSYKAINNSFLLHGYYNYRHLILGQMERSGEKIYYVGVPGNYFEREKQVAIMFGFESFECQEEPAQAGDFGYYMIRAKV